MFNLPVSTPAPVVRLRLHQALFLLALDERKGRIAEDLEPHIRYMLAGGLLAELLLRGAIRIDSGKRVHALGGEPSDDALIDETLQRILAREKARKVSFWVDDLADNIRHIVRRTGMQLVEMHVLDRRERRFLYIIPYEEFPQADASVRFWIKRELRDLVLTGSQGSPQHLALLSLATAGSLLETLFTPDELRQAKKRIEHMTVGEDIGDGVREAIEMIEEAAVAAVNVVLFG